MVRGGDLSSDLITAPSCLSPHQSMSTLGGGAVLLSIVSYLQVGQVACGYKPVGYFAVADELPVIWVFT